MAHIESTHRKSLSNEQLAYWIGGRVPSRNRNLSDEYDYAHENVRSDPEAFARVMPSYMALVDRFAR